MTPEEKSWLAEVEERLSKGAAAAASPCGKTISAEVERQQAMGAVVNSAIKDGTRLLALVKRLDLEVQQLRPMARPILMTDYQMLVGENAALRSQLEVAKKALVKISSAYYETSGGLSAWNRDVLEAAIESDTAIARAALAAIQGEGK